MKKSSDHLLCKNAMSRNSGCLYDSYGASSPHNGFLSDLSSVITELNHVNHPIELPLSGRPSGERRPPISGALKATRQYCSTVRHTCGV